MKTNDKVKIGMVQINNSFARQCYFPYSVGMLQAYAQRHLTDPEAFEFMSPVFMRMPVEQAVDHLIDADMVCFSCYVWNMRLSLAIAQALKQRRPDLVTVFGGPQIPDRDPERFLRAHPCIDLACHGEGERILLAILENFGRRDWSIVPSVSYISPEGQYVRTCPCDRIADLSEVPSPYLEGVFDPLLETHPTLQWVGLWETNRGCPFSCAYCDWGSRTKNQVVTRPLEEVFREADWFRDHKVEFIFCCDANFSLLERDLEIVRRVASHKSVHGYPQALSVQSTKNFTDTSYAIYSLMGKAGLSKGVSLSLQSVHPETLEAIERKNIPAAAFKEAQQKLSALNIETFTDIILPLPRETYQSFVEGVTATIENGQHHRIQFNNLSILPNALMGDPAYQEQYGFETVETDMVNIHGSLGDDNPVMETQQLVVGTRAMPSSDWVKARVFAWMTALLHFDKLLQVPFVILNTLYDVSYQDMLTGFTTPERLPPILAGIYRFFEDKALAIQKGDVEFCRSQQWLNIWWPADELAMIELCAQGRLPAFYQEATQLLMDLLKARGRTQFESVLQDALSLNKHLIKLPHHYHDVQLYLSHNIWDLYQAALKGRPAKLVRGRFGYTIGRAAESWASWEDWCQKVIWWGNKRGAYLYACKSRSSLSPIMGIRSYVNRQHDHVFGRSFRHDRN